MSMNETQVSKTQWETDLENTEKELSAYRAIADGFRALAALPENEPQKYRAEISRYSSLARDCAEFLERLMQYGIELGYR